MCFKLVWLACHVCVTMRYIWWREVLSDLCSKLIGPFETATLVCLSRSKLDFTWFELPLFKIGDWKLTLPFFLIDVAYWSCQTWKILSILLHIHRAKRLNLSTLWFVKLWLLIPFLLSHGPIIIFFVWLISQRSKFILFDNRSIHLKRLGIGWPIYSVL